MYDPTHFRLDDQVVVITGAGAGIGRAIAETFGAAGGGSILAITSMSAENKNKRMASYGSSKAATSHLVRNIAFDLGPKNSRVNGIAPGATRTDALKSVLNDDIEKKMLEHTPIHRLGEPQDTANAALFCARLLQAGSVDRY